MPAKQAVNIASTRTAWPAAKERFQAAIGATNRKAYTTTTDVRATQ